MSRMSRVHSERGRLVFDYYYKMGLDANWHATHRPQRLVLFLGMHREVELSQSCGSQFGRLVWVVGASISELQIGVPLYKVKQTLEGERS